MDGRSSGGCARVSDSTGLFSPRPFRRHFIPVGGPLDLRDAATFSVNPVPSGRCTKSKLSSFTRMPLAAWGTMDGLDGTPYCVKRPRTWGINEAF